MWSPEYLQLAFLSQLLVVSILLPRLIISRCRRIMRQHPPAEYAKLYPVPPQAIERGLAIYWAVNLLVFCLGLSVLVHARLNGVEEFLGWDSQSVLVFFTMLQYVPYIGVYRFEKRFFRLMREARRSSTRSAAMQPRFITQYISTSQIVAALMGQCLFIGLVIYFLINPFDGFGGYANFIGLLLLDTILVGMMYHQIFGKRIDPYMSEEDRFRGNRVVAQLAIVTATLATVYLSCNLLLASLDMRHWGDVFTCIYLQVVAVLGLRIYLQGRSDFEVYRSGPA